MSNSIQEVNNFGSPLDLQTSLQEITGLTLITVEEETCGDPRDRFILFAVTTPTGLPLGNVFYRFRPDRSSSWVPGRASGLDLSFWTSLPHFC